MIQKGMEQRVTQLSKPQLIRLGDKAPHVLGSDEIIIPLTHQFNMTNKDSEGRWVADSVPAANKQKPLVRKSKQEDQNVNVLEVVFFLLITRFIR